MSLWLAGEHRRAEQVISRVAVVEDHAAKCEVAVLDLTLPYGVGRDTRISAVYNCVERDRRQGEK